MGMREDVRAWAPTGDIEELGAVLGSAYGALVGKVGKAKTIWLIGQIDEKVSDYFKKLGIDLDTFPGTG